MPGIACYRGNCPEGLVLVELGVPVPCELLVAGTLRPGGATPVLLADGRVVVRIRRNPLRRRNPFAIGDPYGNEVAAAAVGGLVRSRFTIIRADGLQLLALSLVWGGPTGECEVSLADGGCLTVRGSVLRGRFRISDAGGALVGTICRVWNATGSVAGLPPAHQVVLSRPVLSIVQAAGLVQCLRMAFRSGAPGPPRIPDAAYSSRC